MERRNRRRVVTQSKSLDEVNIIKDKGKDVPPHIQQCIHWHTTKPWLEHKVKSVFIAYPKPNTSYVKIPTNRPVEFKITSDASMNSFWIPDLGGQIYAMSGMSTEINLIADKSGEYKGSSANLSGRGFAGMKFTTSAVNQMEFDRWASEVAQSDKAFNSDMYERLSKPSENEPTALYRLEDDKIFESAINKYMSHGSHSMTMTEREESR